MPLGFFVDLKNLNLLSGLNWPLTVVSCYGVLWRPVLQPPGTYRHPLPDEQVDVHLERPS